MRKRNIALVGIMMLSMLGLTVGCGNTNNKDKNVNSNVESNSNIESNITSNTNSNTTDKVYSDDEIISAAINYYNKKNNTNIKLKGMVESKNDNEVSIRIYEDMDDHIATVGNYTINNKTLKGVDELTNDSIDLNN